MESEKQILRVGGLIVIAQKIPAFHSGEAHVYLEDVSRADAESTVIAETIVENIEHNEKETEISFCLEIAGENRINPKNFYSVRVWIDTDSSGKPSAKDLFSDCAYRALTHGFGDFVKVKIGF